EPPVQTTSSGVVGSAGAGAGVAAVYSRRARGGVRAGSGKAVGSETRAGMLVRNGRTVAGAGGDWNRSGCSTPATRTCRRGPRCGGGDDAVQLFRFSQRDS